MRFEDILKMTQKQLFNKLSDKYRGAISSKGQYILVKGKAPILLVAHLDTVHKEKVTTICKSEDGNIIMSPQGIGGDDRCGVYALIDVYEKATVKPWLLFTCDEEVGGVGARIFCTDYESKSFPPELDNIKCMVEIDRRGNNDAVYYDCGNTEFENYITSKGFITQYGSYSDISDVAPTIGVAAVNLSSGYYNAHTQHEYIVMSHLENTIKKVVEIVEDSTAESFPVYEYVDMFEVYNEYESDMYDLVPEKYREKYEDLLFFYKPSEIDNYIIKHGYQAIEDLYYSVYKKPVGKVYEFRR